MNIQIVFVTGWLKEPGHQQPWYWHNFSTTNNYNLADRRCLSLVTLTCNTMMTSSNGNIFHITGLCVPNSICHKAQWRGALMFSLICAWTNVWVNMLSASNLRHHCTHCDITLMLFHGPSTWIWIYFWHKGKILLTSEFFGAQTGSNAKSVSMSWNFWM